MLRLPHSTTHKRALAIILILSLLLGMQAPVVQAQPAPPPGSPPAAATSVAPPALVESAPADGATWDGAPITFHFDRDVAITAATIAPDLAGAWQTEGATVTFTPAAAPAADARYTLRFAALPAAVDADALSDENVQQAATEVELAVVAASPLRVTATTPADGATEVAVAGNIVVSFNRPVVPLTGVAEQASLPQPLTIDPPLQGTGEWLSTSIYAFAPEPGMAGATEYSVTVDALTAVGGEAMTDTVTFSFTTAEPLVVDAYPQGIQVGPQATVTVNFSQPMDPASTEAAFALLDADEDAVEGEATWNEADTTLTFTPTDALEFGGEYTLTVAESAQPASQAGSLRAAFSQQFRVVPLPAVLLSTPAADAQNVPTDQQVIIRFSAPMSRTLLMQEIEVSPLLTTTTVYSYYNEFDGELRLEWQKEANTEYTVTIGAATADPYGNTLGEDWELHFTTGDHSAYVNLQLSNITHFSASTAPLVSLIYRNLESLEARLFALPMDEFAYAFMGQDSWRAWQNYSAAATSELVWTRTFTTSETLNVAYQRILTLDTDEGQPLAPGIYFLDVQDPGATVITSEEMRPATRAYAVIVISDYNILVKKSFGGDSLAWLTELESGAPVANAEVNFSAPGAALGSDTTGADGVVRGPFHVPAASSWLPLLATVGEPGDANFAIASSDWSSGIAPWDFNINGGYASEEIVSHFYTERPIYRPGQTVYWRGIVRHLADDAYTLPDPTLPISITIRNDRGEPVYDGVVNPGEFGTMHGQFDLAPDATSGYYFLEARRAGPEFDIYLAGVGFQVASYVLPEFEIAFTPSQTEYVQGDTISATVQADYFSGGVLSDAPLTWRIIANPWSFVWDDAPDGRWYSFTPYDPENEVYDPYAGIFGFGLVKEGSGATDANGAFTLELPADLGSSLSSQQWMLDVTIQGPTNQFVNQSTYLTVHRGEFYVGLSPESYVNNAGSESVVDLIALTPDADPVADVDLTLTVYEYVWNSVQAQGADGNFYWETSVERTPVLTETVTTNADGTAQLTWVPEKGGQYQIVAQAEDDAGNPISGAVFVWVADPDSAGFVPWQRENNDRIELVADKREYAPGDVAHVLVPSPFQGSDASPVRALVTIERTGVVTHEVITLESNSQTLDVPITADQIPNIFVGVTLIKGVDESNPSPAIRVGYVQLTVDPAAKAIDIAAYVTTADGAESVRPGDTVTWTLALTDQSGDPVTDAEVSVALVDQALFALVQGNQTPLIETFYLTRPLGIVNGATLIINADRLSQQLAEGAKGGGGGGNGMGGLTVREDFPDTAFWRADFVSDAAGLITFAITLPDSLTSWELSARAVSADTLVGETTAELVVSKELQVRPALPRFFTAGDRALVGAVVINTSDEDSGEGTLEVSVEGASVDGDTEFALELAAGASDSFFLPVTVLETSDVVTFTWQAEAGALSDAVRMVVPVARYQSPEVVATAGEVPSAGVAESILVPQDATDEGDLIVNVEPSLAAGMVDALAYLEHYAWECTEQTVSRFLPNLFTMRALQTLGIEDAELESQLAFQMGIGTQKLLARQNADGGWGNWQNEVSNPFITAYVLWGLHHAQQLDYTVPQQNIDRAVAWLDRSFAAPDNVEENWRLNEMAFTHFVLSEMGEGDPGRMSTLFDVRERLANYGTAWLALALSNVDASDARIATLLDDLRGSAVQNASGAWWQEEQTDWQTLNTDTRSTAIILGAFARLASDDSLLPAVVRWLMATREAGAWRNTQENAWAIIALTDWLAASGELEADYQWTVQLNDAEIGAGAANAENLSTRTTLTTQVADLLRDEANVLRLARDNDSGALYYTAHLRYFLDALAIQPQDRGIVVDRRFDMADGPVASAQIGDVISVTVTVIAPTDLHHVRVDVPIPAGTEILDPNLTAAAQFDEFGYPINRFTWDQWNPTWKDYRDNQVALFQTYLPAGTYRYTFYVRATTAGEFRVLPAYAEMMYFTEVWGRSGGSVFTVAQ